MNIFNQMQSDVVQ